MRSIRAGATLQTDQRVGQSSHVAILGLLCLASTHRVENCVSHLLLRIAADPMLSFLGELLIGANESLLYTFSGKPPLAATGFWSLTAYNADNYLVANDLDVYALGDRSNLTYYNGDRVYGSNASSVGNGVYQILLQPADATPPKNWTSN
ncbi:hypothetical protein LTR17_004105 [Elasticomyces elasticus]|nr:hypothetical protein LTR17_004105 [Elasticomyces elasticus]